MVGTGKAVALVGEGCHSGMHHLGGRAGLGRVGERVRLWQGEASFECGFQSGS